MSRPIAALLLCLIAVAPRARAQQTFTEEIEGATAVVQTAADADVAERASQAAFDALRSAGGTSLDVVGPAVDRALAAAGEAGAPATLVGYRGAIAAGDAPAGMPGWMMTVGFGTPGFPKAAVPLRNRAVASSAVDGDPLKITVLAPTAAEATTLAAQVRASGRNAGRKLVAERPGVDLMLEDARFASLFDSRSLDGWTTVGGRYDGEAIWSVERGAIVGRTGPNGEGGLLYTDRTYTSYVLEMEVDVEEPFDSGIFVHMLPRAQGDLKGAQVTLDNRPDGEIAAIYADGYLEHHPEVKERYRQGEWNHFEVRVTGFDYRVEVWMNGDLVCDYQLPPGSEGFASHGRIGVQVHGGNPGEKRARFRNLRIRELPVFAGAELAGDAGWTPLFNGKDLTGWERHGAQEGYRVEDGVLAFPPSGDGHLATTEDFTDFALRFDFKIARMANSGLFLRAARDGSNPAFSGAEIQILDDFNWEAETGSKLKDWQLTGSLYGAVPAGEKTLHPIGEWNTYEVLYRGSRLAVALNGRLLYDVDTHALEPESGAPFAERARAGFLGLQAHSGGVDGDASLWFRDVLVKRL